MKFGNLISPEVAYFILSALVVSPCATTVINGASWTSQNLQCVPEDSPINVRNKIASITEIDCLVQASRAPGAMVVQFNQVADTCVVLNFQSICRALIPEENSDCKMFFKSPINSGSLNAKLKNVWLADRVNRLDNLACQVDEDSNRLHPVGVSWSNEGAVFDGTSAYAVLNKSTISFANGLTWLVRIKRQPQIQPILEFANCNALDGPTWEGILLWEFDSPGRLLTRAHRITGTLLPFVYSPANAMAISSDSWQNIAFTVSTDGSFDIFVNNGFLPRSGLYLDPDNGNCDVDNSNICLYFGMRVPPPELNKQFFKGTLGAVAFADASMTEAEIRDFFDLIG